MNKSILLTNLRNGDEQALDQLYLAFYDDVLRILIHKKHCQRADAEDIYADAVLKLRQRLIEKPELEMSNLKSYLIRIAFNLYTDNQRRKSSQLQHYQAYISQQERLVDSNFDVLIESERRQALAAQEKLEVSAIHWAMAQLKEDCRQLLTDTIVKGLKPRNLVEKYGYKTARVVTTKKARCKQALKKYVVQFLER